MLYGVIADCNSLREMSAGILSYGEKIHHCGLDYAVPKSTLADANKRRNVNIFEGIYQDLVETYRNTLSDSVKEVSLPKNLFAIDSTTISLFKPIFECVGRHPISGKPKGGIKSHQKLDLNMGVPIQIKHTHAKQHDSIFMHQAGVLKKDEIGILDKAYIDYELFARFITEGIFFVTRLKENAKEEILKDNEILDATPQEVLRDCQIKLKYKKENIEHDVELRMVVYYDSEKEKCFYFLTNIKDLESEKIAAIYKKRWAIELFFKKMKQNFPLKYFYGDNENAIQIQIWCVLIANLLLTILQKKIRKKWSYSNFVSLYRKHLFSYVNFERFFNNFENFAKEFSKYMAKNKNSPPNIVQQEFDF